MRACTTASGAVFFIPDKIERKTCGTVSYQDLAGEKPAQEKLSLFGKIKDKIIKKPLSRAA